MIGDVEIGPYGAKRCFGDSCEPSGLGWLGGGERWMRIGMGTWAGGFVSMIVLVVLAAGLAAKRVPKLAAKTALVSIVASAIAGGLFALKFPSENVNSVELGRGIWLFVAGIVLGALAAVIVLRAKPIDKP